MSLEDQLAAALARYPRGLPLGLELPGVTLAALQEWRGQGRPREVVGLVWRGRCRDCGTPTIQLTGNRPAALRRQCAACDLVGGAERMYDVEVAEAVTAPDTPARPVQRRGRLEEHVVEVWAQLGAPRIALHDLIARAADLLPAPEENRRDTRRQHVTRAVQSLARERDGLIRIAGGDVVSTGNT